MESTVHRRINFVSACAELEVHVNGREEILSQMVPLRNDPHVRGHRNRLEHWITNPTPLPKKLVVAQLVKTLSRFFRPEDVRSGSFPRAK